MNKIIPVFLIAMITLGVAALCGQFAKHQSITTKQCAELFEEMAC